VGNDEAPVKVEGQIKQGQGEVKEEDEEEDAEERGSRGAGEI
jgi:hypothetical protein